MHGYNNEEYFIYLRCFLIIRGNGEEVVH